MPLARKGRKVGEGVFAKYKIRATNEVLSMLTFGFAHINPQDRLFDFESKRVIPHYVAIVPKQSTKSIILHDMKEGVPFPYVSGIPNRQIMLQRSTNLTDWTSVYTNSPAGESFSYSDNRATNYQNVFYRTVSLETAVQN